MRYSYWPLLFEVLLLFLFLLLTPAIQIQRYVFSWCRQNFHVDWFFFGHVFWVQFSKCTRSHLPNVLKPCRFTLKVSISMLSFRSNSVVFLPSYSKLNFRFKIFTNCVLREWHDTMRGSTGSSSDIFFFFWSFNPAIRFNLSSARKGPKGFPLLSGLVIVDWSIF
jgi:hypothetical protein